MKKLFFALMAGFLMAQTAQTGVAEGLRPAVQAQADTLRRCKPFKAYLVNDEYKMFLRLNLYDKDVKVPGQDVYGELDGYFGSQQGSGVWLITSSELKSGRTATLEVINDYGSEDFTATLRLNPDGSYTLKRHGGSTLKFAVRGKWQKLPATIELVRK